MRTSAALAFVLAAAGATVAAAAPEAVTAERIVAVVNSEIILLSEVKERAAQLGQPIDDSGPPEARRHAEQQLRAVLDRMVDDVLVIQQATDLKLKVDESEVDRAIEEVKKQNNLDGNQFVEALQTQGYSMASYRKDLRKQILRLKVINTAVRAHVNVTDDDVRAFYDQTARHAGAHRSAHVLHVLVAVPAGADDKAIADRRRAATRVLEEERGGRDFAALAKQHSDDAATRDQGGDLGWLSDGESLLPALSEVVFSMDVGEVRGPIRTDRGFEVVKLAERKESADVKSFAEAKDSIRQQLYSQQMEKQTSTWLQEIRKKAHIDVRL